MSGIYIHIPFCKKACHYCNFHFSTNMSLKTELINAIEKEIYLQKQYLDGDKIRTIYFGGGTPSILNEVELLQILNALHKTHKIDLEAEVTLEANPDDLTQEKLSMLKSVGINRLSIGIQSFFDEDLVWMNRSHNARQAIQSISDAQEIGLTNISIDLIFGNPTSTPKSWIENLEKVNQLNVPHLSCYGLTVEPNTALELMIQKGKSIAPKEEDYAIQFVETMQQLEQMGYDHYEISNYAKEGKISQHNTSYWKQEKYLGLGPAAHSFNGQSRQWNVNNNPRYIRAIHQDEAFYEKEVLKEKDIYNEYLMTGLRTKWGCKKERVFELSDEKRKSQNFLLSSYISSGEIIETEDAFVLTKKGKLMADHIISSLFIDGI